VFVKSPVPQDINDYRPAGDSPIPVTIDLPDYPQYYSRATVGTNFNHLSISPVAMNWTRMVLDGKLKGPNPCNYDIVDGDAAATIGKWTASKFKDYWCQEYTRQVIDFNKWRTKDNMGQVDIVKRNATYAREQNAVSSMAAFYRHNTYFIYIQVAGFLCVTGVLFVTYFYEFLCGRVDDLSSEGAKA
jgi:hypothetical protein